MSGYIIDAQLNCREENYVYIDDDGQGARFQYGHGTEADHLSSRVENKNIIEECKLDEAGAHGLAGVATSVASNNSQLAKSAAGIAGNASPSMI